MTQPLGLPKSTWINSPSYPLTGSFPPAPTTGMRIQRPDLDYRWYSYNGTSWIGEILVKSGVTPSVFANPILGDRLWRTDLLAWYTYNGAGSFVADSTTSSTVGTSFPGTPTNGQRFLRTDVGSAPGTWFTYSNSAALWIPDGIAGSTANIASNSSITISGTSFADIPITFNQDITRLPSGSGFSGTPLVVANIISTNNESSKLIMRVVSVSSTGFTARLYSANNTATTLAASSTVIAWQATKQ